MQPSKWQRASLEAGKKSLLTKSYMRTLVILSLVSTTGNLLLVHISDTFACAFCYGKSSRFSVDI